MYEYIYLIFIPIRKREKWNFYIKSKRPFLS